MFIRRLENIGRTYKHLQRFSGILRVFLKYGYEDIVQRLHLPGWLLNLTSRRLREEQERIAHLTQPEKLRLACEELGPTFVKMGQIFSTRADLLPEAFTKELAKLQDQVAPFSFEEARAIIEKELKKPLEELFETVDQIPLGSASMAQVYRARLLTGEDVVLKVQRPGIQELVKVDLEIMHHLAQLIENHVESWRLHRPTAIVAEISKSLYKEIDFRVEAAHLERFAWQFAQEKTIYIPKLYHAYTTERVLVMEYIDGIKASKLEESNLTKAERKIVAERIADLVMKQIFEYGFFHADPHPANIHILPNQVICFLDFGMMGFFDQRGREGFADLVWGISRRNEISVTNALLKLASADSDPPRHGMEADVADFMHQHFYRPMKDVEFGKLIGQLFHLTSRYGLRIPPDFLVMLKAMSLTESLVRRLYPEHDVIEQTIPFMRRARMQRVKPKRLLEGLYEFGMDFSEMARELPAELRRIFSQIKTGEARMVFRHEGLGPLITSGERISNRLSFSIVLASLIIGSSLIIHSGIPPKWHDVPVIGLIGYIIAALMGFGLLISILRHGKM